MSNRTIEINEAINSGEYLLSVIDDTITNMDKAQNWGFFDLAINNSLISSIIKNKKLHDANNNVSVLKEALDRFNDELQDVRIYYQPRDLRMSTAIEFFDCFLDNILIDGYTFLKIINLKNDLLDLKNKVENILNDLRNH